MEQTLDDLFPSPWLKSDDFAEGEEKTLTIKSFAKSTQPGKNGGKPKELLDLTFIETEKTFGANWTNREAIKSALGNVPTQWIGKKITLMTAWVQSYGEMVRAVRVKPTAPNGNGNGNGHSAALPTIDRPALLAQFKQIRERIRELGGTVPELKGEDIAGEKLLQQITAHLNIQEGLEAAKL